MNQLPGDPRLRPDPNQSAMLAALTEQLRAANVNLAPPGAWPAPQPTFAPPANFAPTTAPQPCGLLVPVTIQTSGGEVSTYVQLPPAALANPAAAIEALARAGWPIRIYTRRDAGSGYGK